MKETFSEFCIRIDRTPRVRNEGKPHECIAILPFPDSERWAAFHLSDYYVSASVSGTCLEFRPIPSHPMILISRTFDVVTPESAEEGESAESGFLVESEFVTFRELVSLMRAHPNPSCYPARGEAYEWLSSYPETDYRDASERTESLHFDRENPPRLIKYWRKAMVFSGIIRK